MSDNPKLKSWEQTVHLAAYQEWEGPPLQSPVIVQCRFVYVRPTSHFNKSGAVKTSAPFAPRFDLDKLTRAVWDGLTGIVFDDDSRVVQDSNEKAYGDRAGVEVTVIELVEQPEMVGA